MNYLLIDVGSSFIKYNVYHAAADSMVFASKAEFPADYVRDENHFMVSRKKIEDAILQIFFETEEYKCEKVFISVQMHGYIVQKEDNTFSEYISWRDNSGDITQKRFRDVDFHCMGTALKKNLPLTKITKEQQVKEFYTLGSYISWFLTGNNVTHITDACASGFFYADSGQENMFAEGMTMPRVCMEIEVAGEYRGKLVYVPMGDHQISFLGSGAGKDKYLINIGTATHISCVCDAQAFVGKYEKRPYFQKGVRLYTVSGFLSEKGFSEKEIFFAELINAVRRMPPKEEVILGGGGSCYVRDYLKECFAKEDILCSFIDYNIGMEGLKRIANEYII